MRHQSIYDRIMSKGRRGGHIRTSEGARLSAKEKPLRAKALRFARNTGIPLTDIPGWKFQWDGKQIATHGQNHSSIIHDVAHWCIATPSRRRIVEFGLGPGPDSSFAQMSHPKAPELLSHDGNQREEERASLLGILIELHLGMFPANTLVHHSWTGDDVFERTIDCLVKRGFINAQGKLLKIGAWSVDKKI